MQYQIIDKYNVFLSRSADNNTCSPHRPHGKADKGKGKGRGRGIISISKKAAWQNNQISRSGADLTRRIKNGK